MLMTSAKLARLSPHNFGVVELPGDLLLARRQALSALDVLVERGRGVPDRPSNLYEAGSGAVHPGLRQPRQRNTEELGGLPWMQQGIKFVGLCKGTHGPPSFSCRVLRCAVLQTTP